MSISGPAPGPGRGARVGVLTAVGAVVAACLALFGYSLAESDRSWPSASPRTTERIGHHHSSAPHLVDGLAPPGGPGRGHDGLPGVADGVVAAGTTVFDSGSPAVSKLDPGLLGALRDAAADATRAGVVFYVDSGWRSRTYQQQLFRDAVSKYGSVDEAARWVAPPGTSAHETGNAVDIGHQDAAAWLAAHGSAYGLCRIYGNEPWHFELRPAAVDRGCPPMYADASDDPRTRR